MRRMRFSIANKLGLGFGLFMAVVGVAFLLTNNTMKESRVSNDRINLVYSPSLHSLEALDRSMSRVINLTTQWAYVQRSTEWPERKELVGLASRTVPQNLLNIRRCAEDWSTEDRDHLREIEAAIGNILNVSEAVRALLPDHQSYNSPDTTMLVEFYFLEGETMSMNQARLYENMTALLDGLRGNIDAEITQMNAAFDRLRNWLVNIALFVLVGGLFIGFFTARSIVRPVNSLRRKVLSLGQGIYSVHPVKTGNDEIGDMADAVAKVISSFERTKEFSIQLGAGNFALPFTPLSEHDELGKALLQMRQDLASYRNEMETKVAEQTHEIRVQKEEVEQQREKVTALYNDLQDSIRYAQRLQQSVLPSDDYIRELFPDSFVFYRPKATVSGDFYWFRQQAGKKIFAAADCTGHGVPGAFMSLVGHNVLNQVTKVFTRPAQILNGLNRVASEVIKKQTDGDYSRDGMDVAMCVLDPDTMTLEFSGAHNPMYLIRNGALEVYESDPFSIGSFEYGEREFRGHSLGLQTGDCIYLFSDGYSDQFGGPRGKKFLRKQFRETLLRIHRLPMAEQKWRLAEILDRWQGELDQVDDILVIGVRV